MTQRRLKYLANVVVSNVDKKSSEAEQPVRLCNYTDVYYNERITGSLDFMIATATRDQQTKFGLRRGDVVLTKDSETPEDIGVSAWVAEDVPDLVCGYHLAIIRAYPERADGRYLYWVIASAAARQQMSAAATGVTRFGLRAEAIADLRIPLFSIDRQRGIADDLDRETSRIEALIQAKKQMMELIDERRRSTIEHLLWGDAKSLRPATTLRRVASRIDVGIAEAATHAYAEVGVPLLRSMNIRENVIDSTNLLFIAPWFAERNRSKYVYANDILTVRTGAVGVSALVPPSFDHSQCFTQLITTVAVPNNAEFVSFALNSQRAREYFQLTGWGSAQANISVPILGAAPIPIADPVTQLEVADQVRHVNERCEKLRNALTRQLRVLAEHRQALIAASVVGELEIPGAVA